MIEWLRDQDSAVALDTRWHPAVISSWYEAPSVSLVDRYYAWSDSGVAAAIAAEQRLIHIADLTHTCAPSALVRKRFYEHVRNDLASEVTLVNILVLEDAELRGIVQAMHWLSGGLHEREVVLVDRMSIALELTLARLRAERIPPPAGLDPVNYEPPRSMC